MGHTSDRRLSVVFFGRRSLLSARVLEAVSRTHRVVAVVESQPKGYHPASGPIGKLRPSQRRLDLEAFARKHGIPYLLLWSNRMDELAELIERVKPDVGLIAVMLHLMPAGIMAKFPLGVLNVHPSLLPKYRGPNPVFWAYFNQEKTTGVTVHFIDDGEDTGDIVRQAELPIAYGEHGRTLENRYCQLAADIVPGVLDDLSAGTLTRTRQHDLPCPQRGRLLRKGEDPIGWNTWPIERTHHVLCGTDEIVDLLPKRPFPWSVFEWSPVACTADGAHAGPPLFVRHGLRFHVQTPAGLIRLRPRFSLHQAKRALQKLLSHKPKGPSITTGRPSSGILSH